MNKIVNRTFSISTVPQCPSHTGRWENVGPHSVTDQRNTAAETDYFSGDSISEISPGTIYTNPERC